MDNILDNSSSATSTSVGPSFLGLRVSFISS